MNRIKNNTLKHLFMLIALLCGLVAVSFAACLGLFSMYTVNEDTYNLFFVISISVLILWTIVRKIIKH